MSEIKKNIETCRGEDVLAEVSAAPQDPHFGSLVNEALDPLKQQALHQAGYDGYSEVIAQHKPYTFASFIVQMKSNLLLLLRALWQFPFGSGTLRSLSDDATLRSLSDDASLRSLSDMWQHYITRLQGNETHGIPSRLSSLTDLPSAPLLLADRKISGVPDAVDGMSWLRVLCDSTYAANITELTDDNEGWTCGRDNVVQTLCNYYPNLNRVIFHCKSITQPFWYAQADSNKVLDVIVYGCESINLPTSDYYSLFWSWYGNYGCPNITLTIYGLEDGSLSSSCRRGMNCGIFNLPDYKRGTFYISGWASYTVSKLRTVRAGCKGSKSDIAIFSIISDTNSTVTDFEIGDFEQPSNPRWTPCQSLNVSALQGLTAENMYNHILCRLKQDEAGCGSGVTITLGSTNIAKLEAVEEYNTLLTELEDVYGYTFA